MSEPGGSALQRAHALSAQATDLTNQPSPSIATLSQALQLYRQAGDLFNAAAAGQGSTDDATARTLHLLVVQHRQFVRELERRITGSAQIGGVNGRDGQPTLRRAATVPAPNGALSKPLDPFVATPLSSTPSTPGVSPISAGSQSTRQAPLGLAAVTAPPAVSSGIASRLTPNRSVPPFALRPPPAVTSNSGQTATAQTVSPFSITQPPPAPSPLYSSSSSSESAESYVMFGLRPGPGVNMGQHGKDVDPFSRFWGMLDGCLQDISRPLIFAGADLEPAQGHLARLNPAVRMSRRSQSATRKGDGSDWDDLPEASARGIFEQGEENRKQGGSTATSSGDSFYLIGEKKAWKGVKTAEELELENDNLRSSLDALAKHAHEMAHQNEELRKRSEERDKMLRDMATGVRREVGSPGEELMQADKARLDTSVMLQSQVTRQVPSPSNKGPEDVLRRRVAELESEVGRLKAENAKQAEKVQRYSDRLEKIKLAAKAKREAKGEGGGRD